MHAGTIHPLNCLSVVVEDGTLQVAAQDGSSAAHLNSKDNRWQLAA
ncbi:MAG TPA: hypothetical protein VFE24_04280 [Pirellulales bacterium]|jgi:hypothetical protein|nr:hypothetical protein [Pirellulales bacterium]